MGLSPPICPSRGRGPSPVSVVQVAGAALVTPDAVEPVRTQAGLAVFARKARFTEAGAAHVVALAPVDTLAGLRTAHSVPAHRTLVLAPVGRKADAEGRLVSTL